MGYINQRRVLPRKTANPLPAPAVAPIVHQAPQANGVRVIAIRVPATMYAKLEAIGRSLDGTHPLSPGQVLRHLAEQASVPEAITPV